MSKEGDMEIALALAQRLSNEDDTIRKQAWESTKSILFNEKTQDEDVKKIWVGLYFWYWHSDGRPYQKQVRDEITLIITSKTYSYEMCLRYVKTGLETLQRYWDDIDYVRINKYELLLCALLQRFLYLLSQMHWPIELINEWNEYLLTSIIPLKTQPTAVTFSNRVAEYYYDYMNDVIYIDEAEKPNIESKKALAYVLTHYLKRGIDPQIHAALLDVKGRLQTDLYKHIDLGDIVKNCVVHSATQFKKAPRLGVGMEKVAVLRQMKKERMEKRKKNRARKLRKEQKLAKEAKLNKTKSKITESKKPKKND
ncbi:Nucleolar protein [Entamoeba marina]